MYKCNVKTCKCCKNRLDLYEQARCVFYKNTVEYIKSVRHHACINSAEYIKRTLIEVE